MKLKRQCIHGFYDPHPRFMEPWCEGGEEVVFDFKAPARAIWDLSYMTQEGFWIAGWWTAHSRKDRAIQELADWLIEPIVRVALGEETYEA
jgi:hypothetical protein